MWNGFTVGVILPTYNEKDSIRKVIHDFEVLGIMDDILVVNNNATQGTSEEVAKTSAREVVEKRQGYGCAIRRGFYEMKTDLIFVCEPDDTFIARDVFKFLSSIDDVDVVYGSRTVKNLIWQGANMGVFLKWGNWAVAKLMQVMYNTNSLSDIGCTFRLIKRTALRKIQGQFRVTSNFFGPEMMLLTQTNAIRFLQIPINYKERVGDSSVTGDFWKAFCLGIRMIILIFFFRNRRNGNLSKRKK